MTECGMSSYLQSLARRIVEVERELAAMDIDPMPFFDSALLGGPIVVGACGSCQDREQELITLVEEARDQLDCGC